jgi:hypothetical protein
VNATAWDRRARLLLKVAFVVWHATAVRLFARITPASSEASMPRPPSDLGSPNRAKKRVEDLVKDCAEVIKANENEWLVRGRMSENFDRWRRTMDPKWAELVEFDITVSKS